MKITHITKNQRPVDVYELDSRIRLEFMHPIKNQESDDFEDDSGPNRVKSHFRAMTIFFDGQECLGEDEVYPFQEYKSLNDLDWDRVKALIYAHDAASCRFQKSDLDKDEDRMLQAADAIYEYLRVKYNRNSLI